MDIEKTLTKAFGEPTPKQDEFYTSKTRYVGYGGARGGGKSHAVRAKSTMLALRFAGIKILVIRKAISDLRRNYIRPLQASYAVFPLEIRPSYSDQEKMFLFPNGSIIEMGYCDIDADADKYRGNEWDVLFMDEATELSDYQYGILNSCVRGVNDFPKRTYLTCNPGGVGHDNIKRLFIAKEYYRSERKKDYTFVQARVWDNLPLLMADTGFREALTAYKRKRKTIDEAAIKECMYASDYVRSLDNLPERIREAHLEGNWDIFSGKYFSEWHEDVHVIEPVHLEPHWRRTASIDYGLDKFAVLWFATDENGQTYCYRNYEESNLVVTSAALTFRELSSGEDIEEVIAPPDLWSRRQDTGKSAAQLFAESGVTLIKAGNDRVPGWLNVKEYLKYDSATKPKLLFFNTCRWITDYMPALQFDIKKPNDVMTEPHEKTHSPDALRYWCSRWKMLPTASEPVINDPFMRERPPKEEATEDYFMGGYA